jgi:ribosomal protein S8
MQVKNRIKSCLAKIKIAQIERKKILFLTSLITDKKLLGMLWQKGFIYGYNEKLTGYIIFLKYKSCGLGVLSSVKFVSENFLNKRLLLNLYASYFMLCNDNQVQIFSGSELKKRSGKLLAII